MRTTPPGNDIIFSSLHNKYTTMPKELCAQPEVFHNRDIYTVSRLNTETRDLLEAQFSFVWIEGEISNLACPRSGHIYFSLKDERCQVRCAMFKGRNRSLRFAPDNGLQVLAKATVSLYADRGEFQLIIESMEESGEGALRRAYDVLKNRLYKEGLFDAKHKQELPLIPSRIGIITSPSGAAIRDVLSVLKRRFPSVPIIIYPVMVQGKNAAQEIAEMLNIAGERKEVDVLILTRGGGSLEDLWSFNEEILARAISDIQIPIITGIGHEIDFTIADFVSDVRAATPSAAAELVTPDRADYLQRLDYLKGRFMAKMRGDLQNHRTYLAWQTKRLLHPKKYLENMAQRIDDSSLRLSRAIYNLVSRKQTQLQLTLARFTGHRPREQIDSRRVRLSYLCQHLERQLQQQLIQNRKHLESLLRTFAVVSPQNTLERGYAILTDHRTGGIIRSEAATYPKQSIKARLATGSLNLTVNKPNK